MRFAILMLLAAAAQQDPLPQPTDEQVKKAISEFKKYYKEAEEDWMVMEAMNDALKVRHEKVIKTVGTLLVSDNDGIRVQVAKALAKIDHPASAEVLLKSLGPNRDLGEVYKTIIRSLGELGWELGARTLHQLLGRLSSLADRQAMPHILAALGQIRSAGSIGPLLSFVYRMEVSDLKEAYSLKAGAMAALTAITGGKARSGAEWEAWWSKNKNDILKGAVNVYWVKETQKRVPVRKEDKAPKGWLKVVTLLGEEQPPPLPEDESKKKKKKKKKKK
ncbi:MAG: HEAT repeat domain-containing protein [Planctomycetota bacterium]|jgi:hypothetical protein